MADFLKGLLERLHDRDLRAIARAISIVEQNGDGADFILANLDPERLERTLVLGVTGPPGVGKSTLTSSLVSCYRQQGKRLGVVAVDPSSPVSGGAVLGDRVRMMGHALDPEVVVRSMASRGRLGGLCATAGAAVRVMAAAGCDPVIIETVGVGQSEMDIVRLADITLLVLAPGFGDDIQAMKAGLLEVADILVVNKADCSGAEALAMDLESARGGDGEAARARICRTVAAEGKGVEELAALIKDVDALFREQGERLRRRRLSRELEILDWAVEMIKPRLRQGISQAEFAAEDPRLSARKLLEGWTKGDPGN